MNRARVTAWMVAGCLCLAVSACRGDAPRRSIATASATTTTSAGVTTSAPATTSTRPVAMVAVIGDSISMLAHDELMAAFSERGWRGSVVGNSSTTVETNRERIRTAAAAHPRVAVIELATNDAGQIGNAVAHPTEADRRAALAQTVSNIDGALDDLAAIACVIWVDINDWTLAPFYDVRATAPTINTALRAEAARRPSVHLAPYRDTFAPADPTSTAWLRANFDEHLLHPATAEARTRIAALVADTVGRSCAI